MLQARRFFSLLFIAALAALFVVGPDFISAIKPEVLIRFALVLGFFAVVGSFFRKKLFIQPVRNGNLIGKFTDSILPRESARGAAIILSAARFRDNPELVYEVNGEAKLIDFKGKTKEDSFLFFAYVFVFLGQKSEVKFPLWFRVGKLVASIFTILLAGFISCVPEIFAEAELAFKYLDRLMLFIDISGIVVAGLGMVISVELWDGKKLLCTIPDYIVDVASKMRGAAISKAASFCEEHYPQYVTKSPRGRANLHFRHVKMSLFFDMRSLKLRAIAKIQLIDRCGEKTEVADNEAVSTKDFRFHLSWFFISILAGAFVTLPEVLPIVDINFFNRLAIAVGFLATAGMCCNKKIYTAVYRAGQKIFAFTETHSSYEDVRGYANTTSSARARTECPNIVNNCDGYAELKNFKNTIVEEFFSFFTFRYIALANVMLETEEKVKAGFGFLVSKYMSFMIAIGLVISFASMPVLFPEVKQHYVYMKRFMLFTTISMFIVFSLGMQLVTRLRNEHGQVIETLDAEEMDLVYKARGAALTSAASACGERHQQYATKTKGKRWNLHASGVKVQYYFDIFSRCVRAIADVSLITPNEEMAGRVHSLLANNLPQAEVSKVSVKDTESKTAQWTGSKDSMTGVNIIVTGKWNRAYRSQALQHINDVASSFGAWANVTFI